MATPEHPASLNPFRQYRQACRFFKETSRATHPAWYQEATELEHQLHIRTDGASISSFYFNRVSNV